MKEGSLCGTYEEAKEDVHYLGSLIDKFVTVEAIKNCTYSGFVHCIDPVSKSILLLTSSGESSNTTLVPGHAVLNIKETLSSSQDKPVRKKITIQTDEEICGRKLKVIGWLKKNLLPVIEKENIIDLGHVSILPPYSLNHICTENPVVALEIRKIIESMPADFVP